METENARHFVTDTLHRKVIDSNEHYDTTNGYYILAHEHLKEEFDRDSKRIEIHHLDGNHSNNVLSNIVVLTNHEHSCVHHLFDETYKHFYKKSGKFFNYGKCAYWDLIKENVPERCKECKSYIRTKNENKNSSVSLF
jgi:hypothetical protein